MAEKRKRGGQPSGASKAREWLRKLCGDPERRRLVQEAIDKNLKLGNVAPYFAAFAQGHGNAPQALDVKSDSPAPTWIIAPVQGVSVPGNGESHEN